MYCALKKKVKTSYLLFHNYVLTILLNEPKSF